MNKTRINKLRYIGIKSNQIKSNIYYMKIYKFKQYKYHKINTNPHEGKLIWGGQVFIIFPKQFSDRGGGPGRADE